MITSRRTFGLLCTASFLVVGTFFQAEGFAAPPSETQRQGKLKSNGTEYAEERISVDHARLARSRQASPPPKQTRQSLVAQAATGRALTDPPEAPLDGTLVKGKVRQTQFLETYGTPCGPVCDCGDPGCGVEPGCGIGDVFVHGPGCGTEAVCGVEAGCGFEVGCGVGVALDVIARGCTCGVGGCTGGCDSGCGIEEIYIDGPGCGLEAYGDCSCDACCDIDRVPLFLPFLRINWCQFDFFAGVQGFTGPLNFAGTNQNNANIRSGSGSFGFYQGFNEGRSLRRWLGWDMATQFGVRATQSNLSGSSFTDETRHQVFVTGGLFRKVDYGLQYGLVFDYLNEDWYFQGDSTQLRGEVSWRTAGCHVFGIQYMGGTGSDTSTTSIDDGAGNVITGTIGFEPTDQYRLFHRRLLNQSGFWDTFGGWTDNDDGLVGTNVSLPLRRLLLLSAGATYLIPNEGDARFGHEQEGWNISLGLVYRPGGPKGIGRYSRPMFDVADNGTFMIDRN